MNRGTLFVVSGPSGAGKGTICQTVVAKRPEVHLSVSATTRKPRPTDVDGKTYYFLTEETFRDMIQNDGFIEWACFCQNYYGTPRAKVEEQLAAGRDVILEIEVQGAMQVRSEFPEAVFVFVTPPSAEELKNRLVGRGTETPEVVEERLKTAIWEYSNMEKYNYILVNDVVDEAADRFINIIEAEKQRTERSAEFIAQIKKGIEEL